MHEILEQCESDNYSSVYFCVAGHNMLMVGILGPTIPCEEIRVRHVGRCQYTVSYVCKERGNYVLVVKWGDQHVPGSPYSFSVQ